MIVPRNKLLLWVALLLPFTVTGTAGAVRAAWSCVPFAVLFLVASADALWARRRAESIRLSLPETVRLSRGRAGRIPIRITCETTRPLTLAVGLALPEAVRSDEESLAVSLPASTPFSRVFWTCVPLARGCHVIDRCSFQTASPLGLWNARGSTPGRCEVRVYPDLRADRNRLAPVFLKRGHAGVHSQRTLGQGREFEKLREYIPGDSYDDIHWKATAKRGRPVTKLYQIERTQQIYTLIDCSRLSGKPQAGEPTLERFIRASLLLGLAAEQYGDLFGLLTFDSAVRRFIRAGRGQAHYSACRNALYTLQSRSASPDFDELCTFVRLKLRRRSLLVFLTDLGDPVLAESFLRNIGLVCRQHLVMVAMLHAPSARPLFSQPDARNTDAVYRRLGGHLLWQQLQELKGSLERLGVRLALIDREELATELVSRYMAIKARQTL
jgi:uncharacterized protein (DUF58 family)